MTDDFDKIYVLIGNLSVKRANNPKSKIKNQKSN